MNLTQCLICAHGGKVDMNKVPCAKLEKAMNIYTVKDCEHFQQDDQKALYVLMTQISNIAGLHEMSANMETTLGKIEERIKDIRSITGDKIDI